MDSKSIAEQAYLPYVNKLKDVKQPDRRGFLIFASALTLNAVWPCVAQAQTAASTALLPAHSPVNFPTKLLKIVVPNAAGGAADLTARTVAQELAKTLG